MRGGTEVYSSCPAQHGTVQYSTVQYSTVQYNTQYGTVQYGTIRCIALCSIPYNTVVLYSTLVQYIVV